MKTSSTMLFDLIKSMTKAEKRYFILHAKRHQIGKENKYLRLFFLIEKQEVYNEALIKKLMDISAKSRKFTVIKAYLYKQITDSLHLFYEGNSILEKAKKQLHIAQILYKRNLFEQAKKLLDKVNKLIQDYELYILIPEAVNIAWLLSTRQQYKYAKNEQLHLIYSTLTEGIEKVMNTYLYRHHSHLIFQAQYQKIAITDPNTKQVLEKLLQISQTHIPQTFRAEVDKLRMQATYYHITGISEKAFDCNNQLIALFDQHPIMLQLYPELYYTNLNNLLVDSFILKKFERMESIVNKLLELPSHKDFKHIHNIEAKVFRQINLLKINRLLQEQAFDEAMDIIPDIKEGLIKYGDKISLLNQFIFYYLIAYIQFANSAYDSALDSINTILNKPSKGIGKEVINVSRLLNLLIHYELGNYTLLDYLLNSTRAKLAQDRTLYKVEKLLLKCLRKLLNSVNKKEQLEIFEAIDVKINNLRKDKKSARIFNYIALDLWVKGHIVGVPFQEVAKI